MPRAPGILSVIAAVHFASLAAAFSFNIANTPRQCQNLTVSITGSGQAPYSLLIVPFGPTPLPNAIEARTITNVPFDGSSTSVTFQMKFPENSQFVAVVSDASAFGSGGTSAVATVLSGQDGCFDPTTQVQPKWLFHTDPDGAVISCTQSRIWWNQGDPQGNPTFQGIIPGGQSFNIPVGSTTTKTGEGIGLTWTPNVRIGTTLLVVGGDDRGFGSAGSNVYTVQQGSNSACLDGTSPSSTPGSPAGGSYPTSTDGSGLHSGTSSSGSSNVGAIVGGVIGGIGGAISIALVLLFVLRRRRRQRSSKERPVDLLHEDGEDDNNLPPHYRPVPFVLDEAMRSAGTRPTTPLRPSGDIPRDRRESLTTDLSNSGYGGLRGPGTTTPSTQTHKKAPGREGREERVVVNYVDHQDAGRVPDSADAPITVELPPAYNQIVSKEEGAAGPSASLASDDLSAAGPSAGPSAPATAPTNYMD